MHIAPEEGSSARNDHFSILALRRGMDTNGELTRADETLLGAKADSEPQVGGSPPDEERGKRRSRALARRESFIREKWDNKVEFLLAVIGFAVDLGNIWRFPYVSYRNGGGAFWIPYLVMFVFGGLPLCYMELALGQYHRHGCISVWKKICPLFKGVGFAICLVACYMAFFYNTIIAWAVYYFFASFNSHLPWTNCNNSWNTPACYEPGADNGEFPFANTSNGTNQSMPAEEYFMRKVLEIHKSSGFENMGGIRWELMLCSALVFTIVYFALWKGPRSSGKAVWITATMPYVVLIILLVRGVTLPGASKGIWFYLTPKWDNLLNSRVWIDAATQIFFSLGPGFGVLMALSSYNEFNNNCYKDAVVTSLINCFTSFLSGFVIFSILGYMSEVLGKDVAAVAGEGGPGLIFVVYPQAIATMSWSPFFSIIFFFMLIMLGIDSTFGGLEAIITAFRDEFPFTIGKRRKLFVLCLVIFCYLGSLATMTYCEAFIASLAGGPGGLRSSYRSTSDLRGQLTPSASPPAKLAIKASHLLHRRPKPQEWFEGGNYLVNFLDTYGVSFSLLFIVAVETIAVCWCYGVKNFSRDVKEMLGFKPGWLWQISWNVISPVFIMVISVIACFDLKPLTVVGYVYPDWSVVVGWTIRLSSLVCIPTYMVYKLILLDGSFRERISKAIKPEVGADYSLSPSTSMRPNMLETPANQNFSSTPTFSRL